VPASRIALAAILVVPLVPMASAQQDSLSIGGGSDREAYTLPSEAPTGTADGPLLEDINDSLRLLPCYELYCDWNTSTIFPPLAGRGGEAPTLLQLSTQACDHAMPVCGALNSGFGWRRGRMHYGVDLKLATGDAVVSAFEGVVRISRYDRTFGNVVVIRHWNGLETLYAHLSKRSVDMGDALEAGDTLGLGGSTGRSTGSHLHFEVRYLGRPIDPKFIFDLEEGSLKTTSLHVHRGMFEALSGTRSYHIVRRGDSLSKIAGRYGTSVGNLCRLNKIGSRSILRVGQRVRYR